MKYFMIIVSLLILLIPISNVNASLVDTTGCQYNKFHLSLGYGLSFNSAKDDIKTNFAESGFSGTSSLFGMTASFPSSSSDNWSASFEGLYRWTKHAQIGIGLISMTKEEVHGFGGGNFISIDPVEESKGNTYYVVVDYLLKSVDKQFWSKWEFSTGVGLSYSSITINGDMGTIYQEPNTLRGEPWELSENKIGMILRTTLDYYIKSSASIQFRVGGCIVPSIDIPEHILSTRTLDEHSVNFSSIEMTLRLAMHF